MNGIKSGVARGLLDTVGNVSWDTRVRDTKCFRTTGCSVSQDKVTDSIGTATGVSQERNKIAGNCVSQDSDMGDTE